MKFHLSIEKLDLQSRYFAWMRPFIADCWQLFYLTAYARNDVEHFIKISNIRDDHAKTVRLWNSWYWCLILMCTRSTRFSKWISYDNRVFGWHYYLDQCRFRWPAGAADIPTFLLLTSIQWINFISQNALYFYLNIFFTKLTNVSAYVLFHILTKLRYDELVEQSMQ